MTCLSSIYCKNMSHMTCLATIKLKYVICDNIMYFSIKYVILNIKEVAIMSSTDLSYIFEQINNLKKPDSEHKDELIIDEKVSLREVLDTISDEIQRVMDENNFTQEDLCRITNMSQSNISKIKNGKVVPKIETLQKIATATHTRLVISFENLEGDE